MLELFKWNTKSFLGSGNSTAVFEHIAHFVAEVFELVVLFLVGKQWLLVSANWIAEVFDDHQNQLQVNGRKFAAGVFKLGQSQHLFEQVPKVEGVLDHVQVFVVSAALQQNLHERLEMRWVFRYQDMPRLSGIHIKLGKHAEHLWIR